MPRLKRYGSIGARIYAGFLDDIDHNPEVRGDKWYGTPTTLGIAGQMIRDPYAKRSIEFLADPLISADWYFQPASNDPLDREIADFCSMAFLESLPWSRIVRRTVRGYARDGFAFAEMTDAPRDISRDRFPNHPGRGRGIVPTGLHERPAWTMARFHPRADEPSQLESVEQWIPGSDVEPAGFTSIPASQLVRWTWDQEGANFTGQAVLRAAYQPWKLKMAFVVFDAIKHDRLAVGTPVVTGAENANDKDLDAIEQILAVMRTNQQGYLVLPHGYSFKWEGSTSSDGTNLEKAIERCNIDIIWNVGAGFGLLGLMGSGGGSYALGDIQQGPYHLVIEGQAKFFAEAFNSGADGWSPVERMVRMNYGTARAVPKLRAKNLPTLNWQELAKTINASVQQGVITADDQLEDEVREGLRIGPRDPLTARKLPQATSAKSEPDPTPAPDETTAEPETEDVHP